VKILAIDTCTDACSAAILADGESWELFELAPRRHAELILPMIQSVLADAGLSPTQMDVVAFARGPGAFTGVRIGTAVAQGIALGADVPLVPVSTLAALALRGAISTAAEHVAPALDARMSQVYAGLFRRCGDGVIEICAERVASPDQALDGPSTAWVGLGSGWDAYPGELALAVPGTLGEYLANEHPHAADIARLGAEAIVTVGGVPADQAVPVYLRDRVVGS